jgi:nucleoside-diphosphate kinase
MTELTILLVKPDAVRKNAVNSIINKLKNAGLSVLLRRQIHLSYKQARMLYKIHCKELFFNDLIKFMTSSTSEVLIVYGENAIKRVNQICGHNDPKKALSGTFRRLYGTGKIENAVHSSSDEQSVLAELKLFFGNKDISKLITKK